MTYTPPVIVSGSTRLTKALIDDITHAIAAAHDEIDALAERTSGQEIGYSVFSDQFTATTATWEQIPGLELSFPTANRPVYLTLDLGLVAVDGVTKHSMSVSYRIFDVTHQVAIMTGYVTAVRSNSTDASEYLLAQSSPMTARIPPGRPDSRHVIQVQVPSDQVGPAWMLNVAWAEGIDLTLKAVSA